MHTDVCHKIRKKKAERGGRAVPYRAYLQKIKSISYLNNKPYIRQECKA